MLQPRLGLDLFEGNRVRALIIAEYYLAPWNHTAAGEVVCIFLGKGKAVK